jgi:hypothetical protein
MGGIHQTDADQWPITPDLQKIQGLGEIWSSFEREAA